MDCKKSLLEKNNNIGGFNFAKILPNFSSALTLPTPCRPTKFLRLNSTGSDCSSGESSQEQLFVQVDDKQKPIVMEPIKSHHNMVRYPTAMSMSSALITSSPVPSVSCTSGKPLPAQNLIEKFETQVASEPHCTMPAKVQDSSIEAHFTNLSLDRKTKRGYQLVMPSQLKSSHRCRPKNDRYAPKKNGPLPTKLSKAANQPTSFQGWLEQRMTMKAEKPENPHKVNIRGSVSFQPSNKRVTNSQAACPLHGGSKADPKNYKVEGRIQFRNARPGLASTYLKGRKHKHSDVKDLQRNETKEKKSNYDYKDKMQYRQRFEKQSWWRTSEAPLPPPSNSKTKTYHYHPSSSPFSSKNVTPEALTEFDWYDVKPNEKTSRISPQNVSPAVTNYEIVMSVTADPDLPSPKKISVTGKTKTIADSSVSLEEATCISMSGPSSPIAICSLTQATPGTVTTPCVGRSKFRVNIVDSSKILSERTPYKRKKLQQHRPSLKKRWRQKQRNLNTEEDFSLSKNETSNNTPEDDGIYFDDSLLDSPSPTCFKGVFQFQLQNDDLGSSEDGSDSSNVDDGEELWQSLELHIPCPPAPPCSIKRSSTLPELSPMARINRGWNDFYCMDSEGTSVKSCSSKKVTFNGRVVVHPMIHWTFAYRHARKGPWEEMARDHQRFANRISQVGHVISPCLQENHRQEVFKKLLENQKQ